MENETKEQLQIRIDLALSILDDSEQSKMIKSVLTTARIVKVGNPFVKDSKTQVFDKNED